MYLDDLNTQMEWPLPEVPVRREQMLDFARQYDPCFIHLDDEFAASTRFGQLVAPGVMTFMSMWAKFVEQGVLGKELIAGKSTKIEWFRPVFAGDTLHGVARITAITPRNPYNGIAEITTDVYNQRGELVLSDVTESVLKRRTAE